MHPMARKMTAHNEAFSKAIDDGNENEARSHLNEIMKYASTLEEDLRFVVAKSKEEVVSPQNGWEVLKFNEGGSKFDPSQRDRQLAGTIIPARTNPTMRKARGTYGRYSN